MSSFFKTRDERVKVNSYDTPRKLNFTGSGVSISEDTSNDRFNVSITNSGGTPAAHASSHSSGQSDEITITNLGGYPGDSTSFLRADGTFAIPPDTGEINTASNVGTSGVGVFKQKSTHDLQFKKINTADSNNITITDDTGNDEIDLDIGANVLTTTNTKTVSNKTLTSPVINSGTTTGNFTLDSTAATFVEYQKPTGVSAAENLVKWRIAESSTNYISFENASTTDGVFVPRVILRQGINSTDPGGRIHGMIQSTQDSGNIAALVLSGQTNAGILGTRPILSIQNWLTEEYLFSATDADFKNNNLINAGINLTNNTLTDTSGAIGDLPVHNGTKFVRKARGTAGQRLRVNSGGTDIEWADIPSLYEYQTIKIFDVYKISTTYYITNKIDDSTTSGSDFQSLIQTILNAMTSPSYYEFNFDASDFELNNPISLPLSNSSTKKAVKFNGWINENRNWGTRLHPSSTFPTTRYLIEGIAVDGSNNYPDFIMDGFHLYCHPDYARSLSGTALNGGATIIDCGGIKLEFSIYSRMVTAVRNITTQYLWRGLHLIGKCWYSFFENFMFQDANANFSGNADLILENGNHTLDSGNPTVKGCHFRNIKSFHTGEMDHGLLMKSGNYNAFYDVYLEGNAYRTAVYTLDNSGDAAINSNYTIASNQFYRISSLDNNTVPTPDNRQGCLYLNGSGTIDNIFKDSRLPNYPNAVKFAGSCKNNLVEIAAYYGAFAVINDAGAGENNTLVLQGGHKTTTGLSKITTSNSLVRIIDNRDTVNNRAIETQSGDGTTKVFNIQHGLMTTPVNYDVKPITADTFGVYDLTVDGTNVIVTYKIAPPGGTSNLKWSWYADIY